MRELAPGSLLFGSLARGGPGRDVDLAVLPAVETALMEQGNWQARLEDLFTPWPVDLLLLNDALPPLTRFEIFRDGRCLFEAQEGLLFSFSAPASAIFLNASYDLESGDRITFSFDGITKADGIPSLKAPCWGRLWSTGLPPHWGRSRGLCP